MIHEVQKVLADIVLHMYISVFIYYRALRRRRKKKMKRERLLQRPRNLNLVTILRQSPLTVMILDLPEYRPV